MAVLWACVALPMVARREPDRLLLNTYRAYPAAATPVVLARTDEGKKARILAPPGDLASALDQQQATLRKSPFSRHRQPLRESITRWR